MKRLFVDRDGTYAHERGTYVLFDDVEKIEKAIKTVLEMKDEIGDIVYCDSDQAMKMLACAIEDLRSAYNEKE